MPVVASVITDDNPVGKCIEYNEAIAGSAENGIGVVKIVSCDKFHTGKVIDKVADNEQCPPAAQERITASLLGKFGTYCVQRGA